MSPKGLWRILVAAAAAILVYTALGFLVVPVILQKIAVQQMTKFLGRPVSIRKIDFNPYAMSLSVHGLRIEDSRGSVILSLDTLSVSVDPLASVVQRALVLREALLLEPTVNVVRDAGGSLNFTDVFLLDWPHNLQLRLNRVRLLNGRINFRDDAVPRGFSTTISRLTATVENFWTLPGHDSSLSVSASSESGERFSANGLFRVHPLSAQGQIAVEDVVIRKYYPYVSDRFDVTVAEGTLTMRSSFDVNLDRDSPRLRLFDGALRARSLKVDEQGSTAPLFGALELSLSGAEVDLVRQRITVSSIVVAGGTASVRRLADSSLNVQHLVKPARAPSRPAERPTERPAKGSPANWSVAVGEIHLTNFTAAVDRLFGRETVEWKDLVFSGPTFQMSPPTAAVAGISLRNGALTFTDVSVEPPVRMALTLLDVAVGAFSTANSGPAHVSVHARIDTLAPLQISGTTSPIGAQGETSVRGLLQNVSLVPLSPYSAKYLGYELTAGDLTLEVMCSIQRRKLDLRTTVSIDGLTLGLKTESPEATKLPVHLAIALLKDANGKITLHIPVAVALDDPKINLQKAVIDGVIHPFTTAAAFPFAALGAQFGGGGEELGFQDFLPGSADLIPSEAGKLDRVLQGMKRWPEILLDIEGSVDSTNDTGDLQLLAADRAESVREYLLRSGVVKPDRIFLIENPAGNIPTKGSRALLYLKVDYPSPALVTPRAGQGAGGRTPS